MRFNSAKVLLASIAAACVVALCTAPALSASRPGAAEILYVPANSNPPVPAGLKVTCLKGPNVLVPSKTCPVVKYLGNTTWAYSFIDNRVSMALVTYDAQNNVVGNITKDGARYVWNASSSRPDKTVTFSGQSRQAVSATWAELTPAPQIVSVPSNSNPPVPAGLKITCMNNGTSLNPSPTCPVVKYQGITTWAYSFIDNRVSMAIVSYDTKNNVVRNVTMNGARYVWQMSVNPTDMTVTVTGQSNQTVTVPWVDVGP
ncbi:MAG TPA: hypothetical protein VII56_07890 [Rhizomicrobium sp.]